MIFLQRSSDYRIEAGNGGADAKCGTYQTIGARANATGSQAGAARRSTSCGANSADAAARRVLHFSSIHAENGSSSPCSQNVRIGDIQVVAGNRNVEVILDCQRDSVIQREIKLAIVHQGIDARSI